MGDALAPADLARPPDLPPAQARLRCVSRGRLVPVVRPWPHRRGDRRQARQDRAVLVTDSLAATGSAAEDGDDGAPAWLRRPADAAAVMEVPRVARTPESVGRHAAVLVLFGESMSGPAM